LDSLQTTSKIEIYDSTLGVTENLQEEVSNNEKEKKLMDYLKQFPKEFRRVILLKYRGANDKEICGKLNISQDKLKNKLKYFKHRFKNEVAGKKITN
jgi:DNA-directed RNA polymerase specialized sigma24 family protein